jgi:hypothetical protein
MAGSQNSLDQQELEELRELRSDIERKDKTQAGIIDQQVRMDIIDQQLRMGIIDQQVCM